MYYFKDVCTRKLDKNTDHENDFCRCTFARLSVPFSTHKKQQQMKKTDTNKNTVT